MKIRMIQTLVFTLSMSFLLHCSSDTSLSLTSSQSEAITDELARSLVLIVDNTLNESAALSAANLLTIDLSDSRECEGGGTKTLSGTQDGADENVIDGITDVTVEFTDCIVNVSDTQTITINGSLDVDGNIDLAFSESGVSGDSAVTYEGSLELTGDGLEKEGTCDVEFSVTTDAEELTVDITSTGKLCGNDVEDTLTINL